MNCFMEGTYDLKLKDKTTGIVFSNVTCVYDGYFFYPLKSIIHDGRVLCTSRDYIKGKFYIKELVHVI